jgi:hypothetical protein
VFIVYFNAYNLSDANNYSLLSEDLLLKLCFWSDQISSQFVLTPNEKSEISWCSVMWRLYDGSSERFLKKGLHGQTGSDLPCDPRA